MPLIKNAWYSYVKRMIERYPDEIGGGYQAGLAAKGIADAIAYTATLPNGADRLELLTAIYWAKNRKKRVYAALDLYISEGTAKRWDESFIYLCARNMGFEKKK